MTPFKVTFYAFVSNVTLAGCRTQKVQVSIPLCCAEFYRLQPFQQLCLNLSWWKFKNVYYSFIKMVSLAINPDNTFCKSTIKKRKEKMVMNRQQEHREQVPTFSLDSLSCLLFSLAIIQSSSRQHYSVQVQN